MLKEFESIAKKLQADFEATQPFTHQGVKGQARERAITKQFLGPYLPKRFSIGTGQIIDSSGKVSKQQDLVIYDGMNIPILMNYEDNQLLFAEQVVVVIEVKSVLDRNAVRDVVEKSRNVADLTKIPGGLVQLAPGFTFFSKSPPIVTFGIGYSSILTVNKIRDELSIHCKDLSSSRKPSALLILADKQGQAGLIVNVDARNLSNISTIPPKNSRFASISFKSTGEALLYFYLILMNRLDINGLMTPRPDYLAYAVTAGLNDPMLSVGPNDLSGTRWMWEGEPVELDDVKRIHDLYKKLTSNEIVQDKEILELFLLSMRIPKIDHGLRQGTLFLVNGLSQDSLKPEDVGKALIEYEKNQLSEKNKKVLEEFVSMIRTIRMNHWDLVILDIESRTPRFKWQRGEIFQTPPLR